MGFSDWWFHMVMQCVTAVSYNIVLGEKEVGPIIPSRGIRQGGPFVPVLVYNMC